MEHPTLIQGTFDRPGIVAWFALAFGVLLVAASISFIASGEASVALYPLV